MKNKLQNLIAEGKTQQAIQSLLVHTEGTDLHRHVIIQSNNYRRYESEKIKGVLSPEEEGAVLAKINDALLAIIEKSDESKEENINKKGIWKTIGYIALIIGILAGIARISGYSLKDIWSGGNQSDSFSVTVLVHGKKGRDDIILKNQGKVILDIGGDRKEETINNQGEATFKELPGKYQDTMALISVVHPQPYFPINRDKKYKLTEKVIYLPIELTGLDKIKGQVIDAESESPLDSVRVSVENVATHTDKFGWFELDIPQEKQAKFVRVTFLKDGYKMESLDDIAPHTKQNIEIALQKK